MDENVRQLPRGRHGLAREEVLASQRGRMTVAVVEAVAAHGYAGTTVAHIVKGARVSRETFYEHFSSKEDCYMAALDAAVTELRAADQAALESVSAPMERLDAFLSTYLGWLSQRPALAYCLLLELRSAGGGAVERERQAVASLVDRLMVSLNSDDHFACEMFVASLRQMVGARIADGRVESLPELREPLLRVVHRYMAGQPVTA